MKILSPDLTNFARDLCSPKAGLAIRAEMARRAAEKLDEDEEGRIAEDVDRLAGMLAKAG